MSISTPHWKLCSWICLASLLFSACSTATPQSEPLAASGAGAPAQPLKSSAPTTPLASTAAPTVSPTPVPPPTKLPEAQLYVIEIREPEKLASDLLEHLYFYTIGGAGGGGGGDDGTVLPHWINSYSGAVEPAVPGSFKWYACSFADAPAPAAMLTLPDGSIDSLDVENSALYPGCFFILYRILPGTPLGKYTLRLQQAGSELSDTVFLEMPTEPIHVYYEDKDWFAGFKPGETIKVTLYSSEDLFSKYADAEKAALLKAIEEFDAGILFFISQEIITADAYGSFQIELDSDFSQRITVNVRGEKTGVPKELPHMEPESPHWFEMCGEQPARLQIGDNARVITEKDSVQSLGNMPMLQVEVPAGTAVKVLLGPFCILNGWAWMVEMPDKSRLILPESYADVYLLEPVSSTLLASSPTQTPGETVPATEPSDTIVETLLNAEYLLPTFDQRVKLTNGEYYDAHGGVGGDPLTVMLVKPIAIGDLNEDGVEDAAILLAENGGGSGMFISLVTLIHQNGQFVQSFSIPVGDRVRIDNLVIYGGRMVLYTVVQGPNDPLAEPSQPKVRIFQHTPDGIVEISTDK